MGLNARSARLLYAAVRCHNIKGPCLTIGRQTLDFAKSELEQILHKDSKKFIHDYQNGSGNFNYSKSHESSECIPIDDKAFFSAIGIDSVESVDVSSFEGADHVFDMNKPGLKAFLKKPYGLIFEGGTAEHVFHMPNYLSNLAEVVDVGGYIVQIIPVNNFVDHGFYQFSPTLFHSFYKENRFDLVNLSLIFSEDDRGEMGCWRRYSPGEFDTLNKSEVSGYYVSMLIVAKKTDKSRSNIIPQQQVYSKNNNWLVGLDKFRPDELEMVEELQRPFFSCSGHCWGAQLKDETIVGDSAGNPKASEIILIEDDRVLKKGHSLHDSIRSKGEGRYSHWQNTLFFSTSDNTDPNKNGRRYLLKKI